MTKKVKLVLVRGLPGSGKSTLAKSMKDFVHLETDMYRTNKEGIYTFNHKDTGPAHKWCLESTRNYLKAGRNVVVSNNFVRLWELECYADIAVELETDFDVIECKENYGSLHTKETEIIEKMKFNWQELPV